MPKKKSAIQKQCTLRQRQFFCCLVDPVASLNFADRPFPFGRTLFKQFFRSNEMMTYIASTASDTFLHDSAAPLSHSMQIFTGYHWPHIFSNIRNDTLAKYYRERTIQSLLRILSRFIVSDLLKVVRWPFWNFSLRVGNLSKNMNFT